MNDAAELRAATSAALAEARARLAAFADFPHHASCDDVAANFDGIGRPLNGVAERVGLFVHVHADPAVRDTARELERELEAFGTEFGMHRGAFARLAQVDIAQARDADTRRLVEHALRDFRRSGVDRDDATRETIRGLRERLVELGQAFSENIVAGGRTFKIAEGQRGLAGLPPDFIAAHPEAEDGSVTLTTDPGDRVPFLSFAERDDLRAAYFVECHNRAVPDNLFVLPELLAKRRELARLLGHESWADYVTADKMSRNARTARDFVERVIELVQPRAHAELAELLEVKLERGTAGGGRAEPWIREPERLFLTEQVKAQRYDFDSRAVRPYFGVEGVKQGVIATSEALFGVRIQRIDDPAAWHASVEAYLLSEPGGAPIARFYLDLHPREGKYKHAAMFPLRSGLGGDVLPEAALVCNFPRAKSGDLGLLLHDEVTTFFHEFGHLLHHLFAGGQRYLRFSGIACEWDFVEVPSQLFEEWAWDSGVLASFARHCDTGEPIPAELVARMRAAEEYGKGLRVLGQMYFALISLDFFERDLAGADLSLVAIELKRRVLPYPHEEGTYFHAAFGHLEGYSAMYYTYMWSLAIAKDVLSRFEGRLMDTAVAREWRDLVLAPGGQRDADDLVASFLGRPRALDAFERWLAPR